ncbi:hypothetical protein JDV02_008450 [Purpureocillium takamizusanense]|uniref:DUF3669 domain-containing protein n=1 Tax=Purpureocillium takamizusanense TaxID=2060973 RepID=A0A9Q8QPU0_9HYPO|nr:uncharacterized protein JDV02_008450 [Purpureocillium takamizusanense]UNI22574.1 hypothetical protein JDV02_008450 [Purpureocillium takamizusanense]
MVRSGKKHVHWLPVPSRTLEDALYGPNAFDPSRYLRSGDGAEEADETGALEPRGLARGRVRTSPDNVDGFAAVLLRRTLPDPCWTSEVTPSIRLKDLLAIDDRVTARLAALFPSDTDDNISPRQEGYVKIGAGACGAIFAERGQPYAFKLAKNQDGSDLWNDYRMHTKVAQSFALHGSSRFQIPSCGYFVPKADVIFWERHQRLALGVGETCHTPCAVLAMERISPLPLVTRFALIQRFCRPYLQELAILSRANEDCLVRPYLGSMQGNETCFFSLRNFKLHLNHMQDLDINATDIARRMGEALAIMHWSARTDARDVEFVLGGSRPRVRLVQPGPAVAGAAGIPEQQQYTGPSSRGFPDFLQRVTDLWVLDFDQVRPITMDLAGVVQAIEAARVNDPYFPRPLQGSTIEKQVWETFAKRYLDTSAFIIDFEGLQNDNELAPYLPRWFISGLMGKEKRRQSEEGMGGADHNYGKQ